MRVSLHAINRWRERVQYWSDARIEAKLLAIVARGWECWPKRKRLARYGLSSTYFRHGNWVLVVQDETICTVIPWRFDEWRKTPPK